MQRTISTLRSLGYTAIETVELAAKRIEVRRERVGLAEEGLRGVNASPASVAEAVGKLREVEGRTKAFHAAEPSSPPPPAKKSGEPEAELEPEKTTPASVPHGTKHTRLTAIARAQAQRKIYKEGRLVHRPEPELKTHTSYLVFAILPRDWSAEDEARAQAKWGNGTVVGDGGGGKRKEKEKEKSGRQMKREKKASDGDRGVGKGRGEAGGRGGEVEAEAEAETEPAAS